MVVKTYRGLLADGGQDRIRLQTIKGKVGYKIVKFQIMPATPMDTEIQAVVKVFKVKQTTITDNVDYTDNTLLATAIVRQTSNLLYEQVVMFDQEVFNQNIYITYEDNISSGIGMNYYLELEVIPLDDAGAEYTTLKDMRQT